MNIAAITALMPLFDKLSNLCKSATEAADSEKYVSSVRELNKDVDATYSVMREVITNDPEMSTDKKLERLEHIAKLEEESKQKCAEAIRGNREHVTHIFLIVVKAALTCGVSLAPEIVKSIKNTVNELPVAEDNHLME